MKVWLQLSYHIYFVIKKNIIKSLKQMNVLIIYLHCPVTRIYTQLKKIAIVFFLFYIGLNAICYASSVYRRFIPTPSISINSAYSFMCIFVHVHIRSCAYSFMCIFFLGSYYKELQVYILCLDCNSKVKLLVP